MKAKIIPSKNVTIEIDGQPLLGVFHVESEWEGFMKLVRTSPATTIIVHKPPQPANPWDFIMPIFGIGQAPDKTDSVEVDIVAASPDTYGVLKSKGLDSDPDQRPAVK